ncbi:MAG: hypothetical protein R6W82_12230 [bacterium]
MAKFEHIKGNDAEKRFAKSRVHSITREYMDYIKTLKEEGGIGVLKPSGEESLNTLRNRVRRAAGLLDLKVKTQKDGDDLLIRIEE